MSSIGNTAIKEIALGSTQIVEAYLGSALVFRKASPLVIPANTLLVRFGNANYDPAAAAQSNGNGHGTWTKVASAYNDWLWTYNNTNWQYWCGATDADRTAILTDSGDISILDHGDISAVTNISNMFDDIGYKIVEIAKFVTGTGITTAYRFAAGIYRVTDYSFISAIGSGAASVNLNQLVYLYTNWVSLKYNFGTVGEGNFPDPFAKTLANGGTVSSFQWIFAFRNFTGAFPIPSNSVLASAASGYRAFFGCTKGGALPSSWPSKLTGNCKEMFQGCFNATNVVSAYNQANSRISSANNKARMFCLAGINNPTERAGLKNLNNSNAGGGDQQAFPFYGGCSAFGSLSGGSSSTGFYAARTLFPSSLNTTTQNGIIIQPWVTTSGSGDSGTSYHTMYRSNFFGLPGSSKEGYTGSDFLSSPIRIFVAFIQLKEHTSETASNIKDNIQWIFAAEKTNNNVYTLSANATQVSAATGLCALAYKKNSETLDESRTVYLIVGGTTNTTNILDTDNWFIYKGSSVRNSYTYYTWLDWSSAQNANYASCAQMFISMCAFNT